MRKIIIVFTLFFSSLVLTACLYKPINDPIIDDEEPNHTFE